MKCEVLVVSFIGSTHTESFETESCGVLPAGILIIGTQEQPRKLFAPGAWRTVTVEEEAK